MAGWSCLVKSYAVILGVLAFAFLLRVAGQLLVANFEIGFLPPMEEWYSGLIPYPILLVLQALLLGVQLSISRDLWRGSGFFSIPRPRAGAVLRIFSYIYFGAMVLRYVITMSAFPERRWFVGTIPIFFHWVLAAYLVTLAHFYVKSAAGNPRGNP